MSTRQSLTSPTASATRRTTRLAPSPTGALHLGNARTFIINWALARQNGWHIILRIEDLDGPRIKTDADVEAINVLRWMGLDWDEQPPHQRSDLSPYRTAFEQLQALDLVYPCTCTRREIVRAQSAPHADEHELRYPGSCQDRQPQGDGEQANAAWRLRVPDEELAFDDQFCGRHCVNVQRQVGDFIVIAKAGLPAYQLAVVVDDARQSVTDIVRGDDLLRSTGRQLWLYRLLGLTPLPSYWHVPLVLGPDGKRLAKRHGDTRVAWYRDHGVMPERIVGLMAYWYDLVDSPVPMNSQEFLKLFSQAQVTRIPTEPITFTAKDHSWLTAG